MPAANLSVIPPQLPPNFCPADWQALVNAAVGGAVVQLENSGFTVLITSASAPSPADRDKLWYNTNDNRTYNWNNTVGAWTSKHPYSASSYAHIFWGNTLTALRSFDGGDGSTTAPAAAVGAMWEEDTAMQDKFPLGVGSLAVLNATGGASNVAIARANLPNITLSVLTDIIGLNGVGTPENVVGSTYGSEAVAGSGRAVDGTSVDQPGRYKTKAQTESLNGGIAQTNLAIMPPYIGGYWIRRTARIYYVAS